MASLIMQGMMVDNGCSVPLVISYLSNCHRPGHLSDKTKRFSTKTGITAQRLHSLIDSISSISIFSSSDKGHVNFVTRMRLLNWLTDFNRKCVLCVLCVLCAEWFRAQNTPDNLEKFCMWCCGVVAPISYQIRFLAKVFKMGRLDRLPPVRSLI